MSWFSNLAEAYDRVEGIAGAAGENVLIPSYHMQKNSNICVVIDGDGRFRSAEFNKKPVGICIPCTEDSESRSGRSIFPHPLHEEIGFLAQDENKRLAYLSQLSDWCRRNPKVEAVYKYILGETLINDLIASGMEEPGEKDFVRFRVEILYDRYPDIWEDPEIIRTWQNYCKEKETGEKKLCYVTGVIAVPKQKHPKGVHIPNNAKLISCNDKENYTYRGRFIKRDDANSISIEVSYKAHSMLKYLIDTQGHKCGSQAIVAWGVDNGEKQLSPLESDFDFYKDAVKDSAEKFEEARKELATNKSLIFRNALAGYARAEKIAAKNRRIAVIAIDCANDGGTSGRLAITFYQDLEKNDYIDRVIKWHETCCWLFNYKGDEYISTPGADEIIAAVYGEPKGESYKKIKKQARERLLSNVVCGTKLDRGWITAAAARVSQPLSYDKDEKFGGGWDQWKWRGALNVTCALVKKYYTDKSQEEILLELDKSCTDRSYLYGRLLAIADRIESHARTVQLGTNKDDADKRPTNAVRYMSRFASKPLRTWKTIYVDQLNPYIVRLDGAEWYQRQIDEICSRFKPGEYESDYPLDGKYLLGYSLQRREFYKNKPDDKKGEGETNEYQE